MEHWAGYLVLLKAASFGLSVPCAACVCAKVARRSQSDGSLHARVCDRAMIFGVAFGAARC